VWYPPVAKTVGQSRNRPDGRAHRAPAWVWREPMLPHAAFALVGCCLLLASLVASICSGKSADTNTSPHMGELVLPRLKKR